jgi:ankyrin repeat protein
VVKLLVAAGARVVAQEDDELGVVGSAASEGHLQVVKYLVEEAGADDNRTHEDIWTPLMAAADKGQDAVVAYLLGRPDTKIDAKDGDAYTALDLACRGRHVEVVKLLVAAGARREAEASGEWRALGSAARGGSLQIVKYLVEEVGVDERLADPTGWTPLIHAAEGGHADIVAYLLDRRGTDIDAEAERLTALKYAFEGGHLEVAKLLVAAGARPKALASDGMGALASAARGGSLQIVKYLVEEAGVDERLALPEGYTPLVCSALGGHADVVSYLLGRPATDIDAKMDNGKTALNIACMNGRLEVVKLLVGAGARLEAQASDEEGALASAAWGLLWGRQTEFLLSLFQDRAVPNVGREPLEVVKYLVEEAGADENRAAPNGWTPLIYAAKAGDADVVAYLLSRPGINIRAQGPTGSKALDIACREGHLEVVKSLVEATGRQGIEERDRLGRTALHHAVGSVNKELVAFLLSKGAQASTKDTHKQETPLMLACSGGRLDMVQVLLKHTGGLHVSERNSEGRTALHLAATSSANGLSSDMVRALLLAGADPSITDNEGRTPRQAAQQDAEHSACVETFEVRAQVHLAVSDVR